MTQIIKYIRDLKLKFDYLLNNNFDYLFEFEVIDKCFKFSTCDPFKIRNGSWIFLIYFTFLWGFTIFTFMKNILKDFSGTDQLSAFVGTCVWLQTFTKLLVISFHLKKFSKLREIILSDGNEIFDETEKAYRRTTRILVLVSIAIYSVCGSFLVLWNFVTIKDFVLTVEIRIPWTIPNSHPSHEINMATISVMVVLTVFFYISFDSFFIMVTIHGLSKMSICSGLASKIGKNADDNFIDDLVKKHLHALNVIETTSLILQPINFFLMLSDFGAIVSTLFQLKSGMKSVASFASLCLLVQFFTYCYMGTKVSTACEEFEQSVYCSKWYELEKISLKKKVLMILNINRLEEKCVEAGVEGCFFVGVFSEKYSGASIDCSHYFNGVPEHCELIYTPGQCCPMVDCDCDDDGMTYRDGERMPNNEPCDF
ncbi:CLUMA_CG005942, isoform A [Clunio marinus]|uniref:Odorant receptor n=1 Tax=Clunio marinus TaxID=568069 RepID=A0A1J1HWE4_9DIPT|nr:CLUMA_CG005942, isoform A [Clunio marinus]